MSSSSALSKARNASAATGPSVASSRQPARDRKQTQTYQAESATAHNKTLRSFGNEVISERIIDLVDPDAPAKLHALHLREAAYESKGVPSVAKNFTNALANLASAWSILTDTAEPAKDTDAHITSANESALYILNNPSGLYNRSIIERVMVMPCRSNGWTASIT